MVLTAALHITAAVCIKDAENGLIADMDEWAGDVGASGKE
jgi:thiamine phosphate synthase YjbQ (UPF0047 family)